MAETRIPGTREQRLGVAIVVWTLVVWIPRIGIIPVNNLWELARIVGSILLGAAAAYCLFRPGRLTRAALISFALWSVGVWGRSLWNYWTLDNPLDLRLVHTALAAGFFYLAWRAFSASRRHPVTRPDQGHGDEKRESEGASLP